jgi:serine/threonine protein kinase
MSSDFLGLCGATLKDTFQFEKVVAHGGFGIVYRGRHLSLGKPVAIKVFSRPPGSELESEALELFFQESRILATLEHPAIVRPYDCGAMTIEGHGELPWIALEWIDGCTLGELLRQHPGARWSPSVVLDMLRPVMEALAEAHTNGIAHRDVAPNNIMVCETSRGRRVRLIDFGIARIRPHYDQASARIGEQTSSGFLAHSPRYPAPEQMLGEHTGTWTDVHAIGLIVFHLLTGQLPYPTSALDADRGACSPKRPTPGLVGMDVGAWEYVLTRAVALDPKIRYADAGALLDALDRACARAESPTPTDGEATSRFRVIDVSPAPTPLPLATPLGIVLLHVVVPTADELRIGFDLPIEAVLPCKLVLQRFAEVSLALTAVGRTTSERPGLYMSPTGSGTRLTRLLLDFTGRRSLFCGQRTQGLREVVCYAVRRDDSHSRFTADIGEAQLSLRFMSQVREIIALVIDEPKTQQIHLVCVGIT